MRRGWRKLWERREMLPGRARLAQRVPRFRTTNESSREHRWQMRLYQPSASSKPMTCLRTPDVVFPSHDAPLAVYPYISSPARPVNTSHGTTNLTTSTRQYNSPDAHKVNDSTSPSRWKGMPISENKMRISPLLFEWWEMESISAWNACASLLGYAAPSFSVLPCHSW